MADAVTLETALYYQLTHDSGVTTLASTRTYANILPEGVTYPAITYQRISTGYTHLMGADDSDVDALVQVDCWAATYEAAVNLAEAVKSALSRLRGTVQTVVINDVFLDAERDGPYDPTPTLGGLFRRSLDFTVFYQD